MNTRPLLVVATIAGTTAGMWRTIRNRWHARQVVKAAEDICVDAAYSTDPATWPNAAIVYTHPDDLDAVLDAIRRWKQQDGTQ